MYPVIAHRVNPLHVYCRLVDLIGKKKASKITRLYEIILNGTERRIKLCDEVIAKLIY